MTSEDLAGTRLLALDVGSKTLGMAVSDPLGITAQGLPTWRRKNRAADFAELERVLREYRVAEIVVGYPLHMSGGPTAASQRIELFAEQLRRQFGLPVHLWDERLTTAEAQRVLRQADTSIRRRSQVVDRMAAVLILQAFLEHRKSSGDQSIG